MSHASDLTPAHALAYLDALPDFERGTAGANHAYGLERMRALLEVLDHPDRAMRIAHVAGTKGKGSTCAMLASMLRAAGRRTGLHTSPHLVTFQERIVVDGQVIPLDLLADLVLSVLKPAAERVERDLGQAPLHFEQVLALALLYFRVCDVQDAVLEVGLGGRLDATNAVDDPAISVITTIGYDHMQILGTTIEEIAAEKAAIIRPHGAVVSAPQLPAALAVVRERCRQQGATLTLAGSVSHAQAVHHDASVTLDWCATVEQSTLDGLELALAGPGALYPHLHVALAGEHQATNAAVAVATLHQLWQPDLPPRSSIYTGLTSVVWPGRLQVISNAPLTILDGAHNLESATALATALAQLLPSTMPLTLILGISRDKDLPNVVGPLLQGPLSGRITHIFVTQSSHARAAASEHVAAAVVAAGGPPPEIASHPMGALERALSVTSTEGAIVITGSLHIVGDVLRGRTSL